MSGLDGINSLQKALGGLQVNESTNVKGSEQAGTVRQAASSSTGLGTTLDKARLRQAISSGSYNVPSSAVADKMVDGLLS